VRVSWAWRVALLLWHRSSRCLVETVEKIRSNFQCTREAACFHWQYACQCWLACPQRGKTTVAIQIRPPLPPRREWTRAGRCAKLNSVVVVLFTLRGHSKRKPRSLLRSGFFTLRLVDSNLPESLRYASAMMLMMRDPLSNRGGVFHSCPIDSASAALRR
jgi:hypothetical protein